MKKNNTYTKTTTEISDEKLEKVNGGFNRNYDGTYDFEEGDVFLQGDSLLYVITQHCYNFKGMLYYDRYRILVKEASYYDSGYSAPDNFVNFGYEYIGTKNNCGYVFK